MNQINPRLSHQYHDAIAAAARDLWEKDGRQENRDLHYWLQAEREILAQQQAIAKVEASVLAVTPKSGPLDKPSGTMPPGVGMGAKSSVRGKTSSYPSHPRAASL